MKKTLFYIAALLALISCSESDYDGTRIASLNKRYLNVSTKTVTLDAGESKQQITVEADETNWNISAPAKWLTVSPLSGNTTSKVTLSTQQNSSADTSRVCVATVTSIEDDWKKSYSVTVTQEKCAAYINADNNSFTFTAYPQSFQIGISANTDFTIDNNSSSWIHVESYTRNNISVKLDENQWEDERTGILTLKSKIDLGCSTSIRIRQKKANITSTTESLKFGHNSSSQTVQIESDVAWTASATSWISVTPNSGKAGTTDAIISVPKNASANKRTGSVYFTISGSNCVEVPIEQEGESLEVSLNELSFDVFGGTHTIDVKSNESWTIKSKPDWIYTDQTSGEGDTSLSISAIPNGSTNNRYGEVIITTADDVVTKNIQVAQKGKTGEYGDWTMSFGYSAENQTFSFTTDSEWNVSTDSEWISTDKSSGTGSVTLNISVSENNSAEARNGVITLVIGGETYLIRIYQDCKYLTISSSAFTFGANAGNTVLSIKSNTQWIATIQEGSDWLTVTPNTSTGKSDVQIGVAENNTVSVRTGRISIEIPDVKTYIVEVQQNRRFIKADMASVDFLQTGGQISFNVTTDWTYEVSKIGTWFGYIKNNDVITVVADENTTCEDRSGAIVLTLTNLKDGEVSLMVPVSQTDSKKGSQIKKTIKLSL